LHLLCLFVSFVLLVTQGLGPSIADRSSPTN
jgi:hypothetical protein